MAVKIVNKLRTSRLKSFIATLLIYDIPLLCLLIPMNIFKYIMVIVVQILMLYICMRIFDDANETKRNQYLHIQFWISLIGLIVSYVYGKNIGLTTTNEIIQIICSLFLSIPIMNGIINAVLYSIINLIVCGSGIVLGVLIETLKENEYL